MGRNVIVSYDLSKPDRNYGSVISEIKKIGSWAHVHGSVWYLNTELTASQVRDRLVVVMDADDSVFVVDVSNNDAAWQNLRPEVATFLKEHWTARYAA